MSLSDAKLSVNCVVKSIDVKDEKIKIRLLELGLTEGCVVSIDRRSVLKKTLLVVFNACCFTLKDNLAKEIVVEYA